MARIRTETQRSAGGVVYRQRDGGIEVAVVRVGDRDRWQLPKGIIDPGEAPEVTAVRETREEAGVDGELVAPLEDVEYWYLATRGGERIRYHKFVHFYLLRYTGGDVRDHDHEVHEARWVPIADAETLLSFPSERRVVAAARALVERS